LSFNTDTFPFHMNFWALYFNFFRNPIELHVFYFHIASKYQGYTYKRGLWTRSYHTFHVLFTVWIIWRNCTSCRGYGM